MKLERTLGTTLLTPDERVGALRLAKERLDTDYACRGGNYRLLAASAAPNGWPGWGDVVVTMVVDRTPRDHAGLGPSIPNVQQAPIRLNRRVSLLYVDTRYLYSGHRFSHGYPALSEELMVNDCLAASFHHWANHLGVSPQAAAIVAEVNELRRKLDVRFSPMSGDDPGIPRWRNAGELAVVGSLLPDPGQVEAHRVARVDELVAAAVARLQALDFPGEPANYDRALLMALHQRAEDPALKLDWSNPPQATLNRRLAALEEAGDLPDFDPEDARHFVLVATGGTKVRRPSLRAQVLGAMLPPTPMPTSLEGDSEEFLL